MDTTPVTPGVLEGLDRFLALNPRPEIVALKGHYDTRAAHEARLRSAKEEFQAAESALLSALLAILARLPERLDWLGFGYAPLLFDPNLVNWQSRQELFFSLFLFRVCFVDLVSSDRRHRPCTYKYKRF